jgi:hypothetical protein
MRSGVNTPAPGSLSRSHAPPLPVNVMAAIGQFSARSAPGCSVQAPAVVTVTVPQSDIPAEPGATQHHRRSKIPAAPIPPPTHMVTRP